MKEDYRSINWGKWSSNLLALFMLVISVGTLPFIQASTQYNILIIQISLGYLAFVAIFYSFVLKKEFTEKQHKLMRSKWKSRVGDFNDIIYSLRQESRRRVPDYDFMLEEAEELMSEIEEMTLLKREVDMNLQLAHAFAGLFAALILVLVDTVSGGLVIGEIAFRSMGYLGLWYGFYKSIQLLSIWHSTIRN